MLIGPPPVTFPLLLMPTSALAWCLPSLAWQQPGCRIMQLLLYSPPSVGLTAALVRVLTLAEIRACTALIPCAIPTKSFLSQWTNTTRIKARLQQLAISAAKLRSRRDQQAVPAQVFSTRPEAQEQEPSPRSQQALAPPALAQHKRKAQQAPSTFLASTRVSYISVPTS